MKHSILFLLSVVLLFLSSHAQAQLNQGDIVVVGLNPVNDTVHLVPLVDIPAGTTVVITDVGWLSTNAFHASLTGDGRATWTTTALVPKGSLIKLVLGGLDNTPATELTNLTTSASYTSQVVFSGYTVNDPILISGDQIFIYEGLASNPSFIFGLNNSGGTVGADNWNTVDTPTLTVSRLPNGTGSQNSLTNGVNAIGLPGGASQQDNVQYTGPTTATDRATWLTRFTASANWTGDNTGSTATSITPGTGIVIATPTTITSLNRVNTSPSNAGTVNWTLTFASAVTGVTASNFSLSGAAATGASVGTPTTSNGGVTWNVPVTTGSTDGTLTLSLANATGLSSSITTSLPFAGESYTMDKTGPTIGIGAPSVSTIAAGAGSVTYTVTYADTNFDASTLANGNITLNTTGTASGSVNVTGSGLTRTVTLSSITGAGTIGISIASGTATDTLGNTALAAGPSTTFAVTAPVVAIAPNDLMVIAYNSSEDAPVDSIALLATADIPNGTTIFLTDRGWQTSTTSLRPTSLLENTVTWVTSGVTAGKIIRIATGTPNATTIGVSDVVASFIGTTYGTLSGSLDPDLTSGDQMLIYTTADNNKDSAPTFIHAFNADAPSLFNSLNDDGPLDGWSDSDTSNLNNTSKLPPGLTAVLTTGDGGSALGLATYVNSGTDEFDNYIYNGPTSQTTRALWIARITTFANWLGRDATTYDTQTAGALSPANSNFSIGSPPSNNADLATLTTTAGAIAPLFAAGTTAYTANVPNATTSVTVTATRAEANATLAVQVNGGGFTALTSGSASGALALNVGANPIDVRVTAQDGTTIKTYTITVTRAAVPPNLTINDVTQSEGNSGTTTFAFTVSLSAPAPVGGVTFDIATANGTATQPGDYTQTSQTSQTIAAGNSTFTFNVPVLGDTAVETNETFFVNVTNITGATALDAQGLGTITNDDVATPPTITSVSPASGPIAGGTTVVITGTGFTGASAVNFGTTPATGFTVNSPTQITATLPAGTGGIFDISVVTGTGTGTGSGLFYYFTTTGGTPAMAASKVDLFTPNGAGKVLPGAPIQYRTLIANTGAGDATTVDFADAIPANTTLVPGSVNVSPLAEDDSYATIVNTQLAASSPSVLSGPLVTALAKVTDNDREFLADTFTISAFDATSANGGSVVMVTSGPNMGSFTYVPAAGFVGVDSFTYTLRDDGTDSTASNADDLTGIGTVVITVNDANTGLAGTQKVWYIDNSYAGANGTENGTSARPFNALSDVSGGSGPDLDGDTIYLRTGSSAYTGGITLLANQTLWGENEALVLNTITLQTAGTDPVITNAAGDGVTVAGGNTLKGFTASNASGFNIANTSATSVGTLTISNVVISGSGGIFRAASGGVLNVVLDSASTTGTAGTGIDINNCTGSWSANAGSISGVTGLDVNIQLGSANITYAGSITSSAGGSISVAGRTGGTVTFSGLVNITGGTGVNLATNTGSTINFTGGLTVSTGGNAAFTATGGGTVNVTGATNTLTTTTGTALNVASTTIGASGLNFRSISSNGATNGIVLNNTGSSGGLTVTGTSSAGTGGTIQSCTSHGISLTSTSAVRLSWMNVTNNLGSGISGGTINGFLIDRLTISGNGNDAATDESGINLTEVTGSAFAGANPTGITNCTITNNNEFEVQITNTSGTLTDFRLTSNTISSNGLPINGNATSPHGNLVNFLALGTASMTLTASGGTYTGNWNPASPPATITATALHVDHSGTSGTMTADISSASFTNNNVAVNVSNANGGNLVFDLHDNPVVTGSRSHALNLFVAANSTGSVLGKFRNNVVGTAGVAGSASQLGFGIRVQNEGVNTTLPVTLLISGNTVQETAGFNLVNINAGIAGQASTKPLNATITANTLRNSAARAITIQQNNATNPTSAGTIAVSISANTFSGIIGQAGDGTEIRLRKLDANGGVFNVTQADLNTLASSNGLTTSDITVGGTVSFNQALPPQPLLFAENLPDIDSPRTAPDSGILLHDSKTAPEAKTAVLTSQTAPKPVLAEKALTNENLQKLVLEAKARWIASGLTSEQKAALEALRIEISDLNELHLGQAAGDLIQISRTAAGNAWFVDETPSDDSEFAVRGQRSDSQSPISNFQSSIFNSVEGVDLLTTLLHEMGHRLGLPDTYALRDRSSIMYGYLTRGERRLPAPNQARGAVLSTDDNTQRFLGATINIGTLPAGKSVTIVGTVLVNDPANTQLISSQGTVSGGNFTSVLTDDPAFAGTTNPTTTPVERPDATVVSIATGTTPTNAASVSWNVTFNTAVSNVVAANFALANTGLTAPSITGVTAVGGQPATAWTVTASTGTGSGTLGLNMANDAGSLSHDITNQPFTGQVYTIDKIAPVFSSITRQTPSAQNTNADTLVFRATFSETVVGVDAADFTVSGTTATISGITGTGPYDLTLSGGDLANLNGTVSLALAGAQNIADTAGNPLPATAPATNQTYTVDNTAPTVGITSTTGNPAANAVIPVTVQFSETVTGFDLTDITVAGGSKGNFVAVDGDTYTFDLTPTGPGVTVTADVAGSAAQDAAGNNNTAATQFTRSIVDAVSIAATTATAAEGGATGLYTFTRGVSTGDLTVSFQLDAGSTATAATDFTLTSSGTLTFNTGTGAGTIVIPNGQLTATVTLTALAEAVNAAEAAETSRLNVVAGSGYVAGSPANATVTITQNGTLVTAITDSGTGSLRQAVLNANANPGADAITFDPTVFATAQTIVLNSVILPTFTGNTTVTGPAAGVTVEGGDGIFEVGAGTTASFTGLTMFSTGPGICISNLGTVTFTNCVFKSNAHGIDNYHIATVTGCTFLNIPGAPLTNRTTGTLTTRDCSFTNCQGGILNQGTATMTGCTFEQQLGANDSAIYNFAGTLTLTNCSIVDGATNGMFINTATLVFQNCTLVENGDASTNPSGTVTLKNTIYLRNPASAATTDGGGNLLLNRTGTTAPALAADLTTLGLAPTGLQNNGGPTKTIALLSGTAINGGLPANLPADTLDLDGDLNTTEPLPFDQRGATFLRAIGTVDVGAFELQKSVSIGNLAAISEGNSGTTNFVFTITRTGDTSGAVNMTYTVSGAAVNGTDFIGGTLPTGTATIADGSATTTVTIPVSGDTAAELNEAFIVTLTAPDNGYVVAGAPATSTITNDDTLTVTINQASGQADPARTSPINYTVVFSEAVTGFVTGDVTVGGAAAPTTGTVSEIAPNNGTTFNVAVSGMTGQGAVTASIGSNVALSAGGAGHAAATSTDNSVVFDSIAPTAGIVVADTSLIFGETSLVTITFSEAVTGFDNADLTIPNGALTPVSSGDGITWTATFTPSANTEAATNVIALAMTGVADAAGNAGTGTTDSNNFVIDTLRPTVTLSSPVADPAPTVPFTLTATFSQAVTGFTSNEIVTTNAIVGTFSAVSPTVYTLVLTPNGSGLPVTANVAANTAQDTAGNGNTAAASFSRATYLRPTISYAYGAPQVAISGAVSLTYTVINPNPAHALTGLAFTDALPPGLAIATPNGVVNNLGGTLTATAGTNTISLSGGTLAAGATATLTLNVTGTSLGVKGGMLTFLTSAETPLNSTPGFVPPLVSISGISSFTHERRFITGTVDAADPTQTGRITRGGAASVPGTNKVFPGMQTTSGARQYDSHTITNTTGAAQDVNVWFNTSAGNNGFLVAYLGSFDPANPATNYLADAGSSFPSAASFGFTIPVGGTVVLVVHAVNPGVGFDYALGINTPFPAGAISTIPATVAAQPTIEVIERSVSIGNLAAISEGNSGTTNFVFTITRTGATTGSVAMTYTVGGAAVNAADFGGTLPTGTATIADGSATTTVTIPVSGDVLAELDEAFTVTLSAPNNGYLVTGAPATSTITNDDTLSVTLNQAAAQADPTNATTINFTAVFSEAVTDFDDAADVTLTGTAGATTTVITGGPTTYNIAVSGMTGSGTVIASIPAASVISAGSAANAASTSTDKTVTYDNVAPALASAIAISDTALKIGDTATVTFTFTEAVTGFDSADLTVPNGSIPSVSSGDGITWTGTLTPAASIEDTSNLITLNLTGVADIATNPGIGTTNSPNYAIDTVAPTVVLTSPAPNPTPNVPIAVTAQFSETVVGFVAGSVTVTNATVSSFVAVDGDTYTFNLNPTGSNLIVTADITAGATQDTAGNNNIAATQFARTINAAPEITVPLAPGASASLLRLTGITTGINSPIATVSDAETPAASLVVTAITVPLGINITNIVNNAGAVTADVSADAGMTAGIYTVVLNVFDGAINTTANLTIEVNNAPTVVAPGIADVRITIGDVLAIPLGAHFADVDLHTLTFTVSGNTVPAKASASITGGSNVTLTGLTYGTTDITIQADDGHSGLVTDTFQVAVGTVEPTPTMPATPPAGWRVNSQTALFDIDVPVQNTTAFDINGFRLTVDLSAYAVSHPTLRLINYSSPAGVLPAYVDYPFPVAIGETVNVRLSFFVATRVMPNPFNPTLTVTRLTTSAVAGPLPVGTYTQAVIQKNEAGRIVLTWPSTPGRWYRIFYSADLTSWTPSATPIQASANQVQWIDSGAPFTQTPPAGARYYMVTEIPAPAPAPPP